MKSIFFLIVFCFSPLKAADYSASLVHFTKDGTATGDSLFPGFKHDSCWDGIGVTSGGIVYIAVSNHLQPAGPADPHGNVAIYRYDPVAETMSAAGDLKAVSRAAGNWMDAESQHKVHTCIVEHTDGKLYFASDDYEPSYYVRGAHLYTIDPQNNAMADFSATQPYVMKRDFSVIPNSGALSDTSGVFVQYYGVKMIALNKKAPNVLYAMLYGSPGGVEEPGHIIKYDLSSGAMKRIGESVGTCYRMYMDHEGDLYYCSNNGGSVDLLKYSFADDSVSVVARQFATMLFGGLAPTASGDTVYASTADGDVFRLDCRTDVITRIGGICGGFSWLHFNLALSPDGRRLYYVIIQGNKGVFEFNIRTGFCQKILDIYDVVGERILSFDGTNVWDKMGRLYIPVWTEAGNDLAMLKLELNQRTPDNGFIAHPRITEAEQQVDFNSHAVSGITGWHWDFGDGTAATKTSFNATHTYARPGLYTVTLTTSGPNGGRTYVRKDYVEINAKSYIFEAEAMTLDGDYIVDADTKADGQLIALDYLNSATPGRMIGTAWTVFDGPDSTYRVEISAVPENDGMPRVELFLNSTKVGEWRYALDPANYSLARREIFTIDGLFINRGDTLALVGYSNSGAYARLDNVRCQPVGYAALKPDIAKNQELPLRNFCTLPDPSGTRFSIPDRAAWQIVVVDIMGNTVRQLGRTGLFWDGRNESGAPAAAGVYLLKLTGKGTVYLHRFILVK